MSPFAVCYADAVAARDVLARAGGVLGVVGYGAGRPAFLPASCPFVAAPLVPAAGGAVFEIWTAASPCRPCPMGAVAGACGDDFAFGAVTLAAAGVALEDVVEAAYRGVFDFLDEAGFAAPIRFWNYLTAIIADDRGLQRYMRFNIGRQRAFAARLRQPVPPAASCVGGHSGDSVIYFLAARDAATAIENPRQVSAYAYPPVYGPSSPGFSRASIYAGALFISGTASIVGHETRHAGDLFGQIAETAANLHALIDAAGQSAAAPAVGRWAVKVYLHNPADWAAVEPAINAVFGADHPRLYLRGDICRPGLLLEIEAFRGFVASP